MSQPAFPDFRSFRSKQDWEWAGNEHLDRFLSGNERLTFPQVDSPELSIILVFFNKAHLSFLCLGALLRNADVPYELIVVDNASSDQTRAFLARCDNVEVILNPRNVGFGEACMQGAAASRGRHLLFLNNDALLHPYSLSPALENFRNPGVGAVGGKILLANGDLQEAGSIIWRDGSALGYGRGGNPSELVYNFRRPVDYCSGAFLFTPRQLFHELGGFDPIYAPAYYEDTDYCMKLWAAGKQVIYEPQSVVSHFESASSEGNEAARPRMAANQKLFVSRWQNVLKAKHCPPSPAIVLKARTASQSSLKRILYIDDRIPHRSQGSGFPRANDILRILAQRGYAITCAAISFAPKFGADEYTDLPPDIEMLDGYKYLAELYGPRLALADVVWISRPHNMAVFLNNLIARGVRAPKIIFDVEAVFAQRERLLTNLEGRPMPARIIESRLRQELALATAADATVAVSEADAQVYSAGGIENVHVVSHAIEPRPTVTPLEHRNAFAFIGAVHSSQNPNADSMRFFCRYVWAEVHRVTGAQLLIAGFGTDRYLSALASDSVRVLGPVERLDNIYEQARVIVAPTRYAAGIPFKAHEAAAYGVPMVVSELIRSQLGWTNGEDVLSAETGPEYVAQCCRLYKNNALWQRLRTNALTRIVRDFDPGSFTRAVHHVLDSVLEPASDTAVRKRTVSTDIAS